MDNKNKSNSNSYNPNADAWAKGLGNPNDPSKWAYTSAKAETDTESAKPQASPSEQKYDLYHPNTVNGMKVTYTTEETLGDAVSRASHMGEGDHGAKLGDIFSDDELAALRREVFNHHSHTEEPLHSDNEPISEESVLGKPTTYDDFDQAKGQSDYESYKPGQYETVRSESIDERDARRKAEHNNVTADAASETNRNAEQNTNSTTDNDADYGFVAHTDIDNAMVEQAEEEGNLDNVPFDVKAKYGLLTRKERKAINDDMAASYSFFTGLPSFNQAVKARNSMSDAMLKSERSGGWSESGQNKAEEYRNATQQLANEYGKSLATAAKESGAPLNQHDIDAATTNFFKQWIKSVKLRKVERANETLWDKFGRFKDRIVESFRGKKEHSIGRAAVAATLVGTLIGGAAGLAVANSEGYIHGDVNTITSTQGESKRHVEKHEKKQSSKGNTAKIDVADVNRAEVHYTADNLPKADYHLWGIARGDGTYDVSHKVNSTAFSTPLPNSLDGFKSYYFEGTTSNPQQQAIYSVNLLSQDQLSKLGFTGERTDGRAIDAFAARLAGDNQLRADSMNALADLMNDGKFDIEFIKLPAGEYENYGIMQNSDGTKHLVYDTIRVSDGKLSAVKVGDMFINMACGNVLTGVHSQLQAPTPAPITPTVVPKTPAPEPAPAPTPAPTPETPSTTPPEVKKEVPPAIIGDTPKTPAEQPHNDVPEPKPKPEPKPEPKPDPEPKLEPKVISKIQRQNAPSDYTVNHQPGSVENPNGVTEHITTNTDKIAHLDDIKKPDNSGEKHEQSKANDIKEVKFADRAFANKMNDLVRKITVITNSNNVTDNGIQDAIVTSGGPSYEEMKHNSGPTTGTDNATGQQSDISNEVN